MDSKIRILLIAGLIITAIVFFIDIYAAGIIFILLIAILMTMYIMMDSTGLPDVTADLADDAKGIVFRNSGNSPAVDIHVALVPADIEFDIGTLLPEERYMYSANTMIDRVKVVATFKNEKGTPFSRTYQLSSTGENYDPLKPMIPLFKWK